MALYAIFEAFITQKYLLSKAIKGAEIRGAIMRLTFDGFWIPFRGMSKSLHLLSRMVFLVLYE